MDTMLVAIILGGLLLLIFAIAGVVLYTGKAKQKKEDRSSLPSGDAVTYNNAPPVNHWGDDNSDGTERYLD